MNNLSYRRCSTTHATKMVTLKCKDHFELLEKNTPNIEVKFLKDADV